MSITNNSTIYMMLHRCGSMIARWFAPLAVLIALGTLMQGCGGQPQRDRDGNIQANAGFQLNGAGATFPFVLYSKWFDIYRGITGIQFNYQPLGSGAGIKQMTKGTVDFGATDGPMTDKQLADAQRERSTNVLHVPMSMGAVVLTYNLPGIGSGLRFSPDVVTDIFLGVISNWNHSRIAQLNPGVSLPNMPIIVVHRSDGSGTNFIFTEYLSKVNGFWRKNVGQGVSIEWPTGIGAKGNEGVLGQVKLTRGSIGYVELVFAIKNKLPYATLRNKSGEWVVPSMASVTKSAEGALSRIPADLRASITDPDFGGYPISGLTWMLVYQNYSDERKARVLSDFLWWAIHDGQNYASELYYARLPKEIVRMCERTIEKMTVNGIALRTPQSATSASTNR